MLDIHKLFMREFMKSPIIIALIIPMILNRNTIIQNKFSYITLKINGPGYKNVFYEDDKTCDSFSPPNEVYINDIYQDKANYSYYFNDSKHEVKLIWNDQVLSPNCLFYKCKDINEIDLSHFKFSGTNISHMFAECTSLTSINLSNFNTSNIKIFNYLFYNCVKLASLDLSSFDSSNVNSMSFMFYNCGSLISINLSHFKTPQLTNAHGMFQRCNKLTSLNLSNFALTQITILTTMFYLDSSLQTIIFPDSPTPNLINIGSMFKECSSLLSIDLSNLITSNIKNMDSMFSNCKSLTSLNLSNFENSKVIWIESIFEGCSNLQYINLKNLIETKDPSYNYRNAFKGIPENIVICINEENAPKLTQLIKEKNANCYTIYCSDDWQLHQKKLKKGTNDCINNCNVNDIYLYEFNGICQEKCQYGTFYDEQNLVEKCKCEFDKCYSCPKFEQVKNLCIKCNKSYYPIENDPENLGPYINCYKEPEGYYLDKSDENNYMYKKCEINEDYLYGKSYIKLKIKNKGKNRVFYARDKEFPSSFIPPNEVIINNCRQTDVQYEYEFQNENNIIILIWYEPLDCLHTAFYQCSNITEVDLSHFDSSSLSNIGGLFQHCGSLIYVNLTNFNTEKVKVFQFMFRGCTSLKSLDLSEFKTAKVYDMKYMFDNCKNLHYLNLKNFEENNKLDYTDIFIGIPNNIIVCINEIKAPNLYLLIKNLEGAYIDCSDDWFIKNNILEYSYITLKIKGKRINKIFYSKNCEEYCSKFIPPNEVLINNIKQIYVNYEYDFTQEENEVKLVWYDNINYLGCSFYECPNITFADLSHFNSSNVKSIANIFDGCISLVYVNFTNFDTSNCELMYWMFSKCFSLISLDLSSFNTKQVKDIRGMFNRCNNLQYINLKNFELKDNIDYTSIINGIPKNVIVCINGTKSPYLYHLIEDLQCSNIDCSDDWYLHQKKLNSETNKCYDNCDNKYEFNNKCYGSCQYGSFYDENNFIEKCKCEFDKCHSCPDVDQAKNLCIKCNKSFYPIENDPVNLGPYINCYKDPDGYYLDKRDENNYIYKLCYEKCIKCEINGDDMNNNCLKCNSVYSFGIPKNGYFNCYKNCSYYYYIDEFGNKICTENSSCPERYKYEFRNQCYTQCPIESKECISNKFYCEAICDEEKPFVIIETQECVEYCDINSYSKSCILRYFEENYEINSQNIKDEEKMAEIKRAQEIKAQDKILENFEKGFTSENYDTSELDNGNDDITETEKMIITLTTTDNQKSKNKNDTSSKVDIGPCEDILRSVYNISDDKKLYMKKIDVIQEGMKIPKIEYDIYCKLNGTNLIKLDKSFCNNVKAEISVHVILTEDIDKYNTSSDYYKDICYISTSDSGTDIILKDRKNEYINNNKAVCQDGCDFSKYDYEELKAICSCDIKESISSFEFMNIDKKKFFENFIDIKNIANINILKCYKVLFSKKGIKGNIGSLIVILIILFHFFFIGILYNKNLSIIKNKIKDIIFGITNWKLVKENDRVKNLNIKIEKGNLNNNKIKYQKKYVNPPKKNKMKIKSNNLNLINNNKYDNKIKSIISKNDLYQKQSIIKKTREIMSFNDDELNQLSYKLALKYDNRTYCEYYNSLIKTKHNFIFSFFYNNDYNSRIIKIDLFFIDFVLDLTVNALFFDDDTMHKIYEDKGKFDFLYQLPKILYTTVITFVLDTPLKSLALSDNYISDFKNNKSDKNLNKRYAELYKKLKIILLLFFLISSIFLLAFWYYISMFCAIYRNTQIHLIKDTLISFGTAFLYPFGLYLLPGIFRIPALSNKRNKRVCLYNMSKLFQMI